MSAQIGPPAGIDNIPMAQTVRESRFIVVKILTQFVDRDEAGGDVATRLLAAATLVVLGMILYVR